MASKLRLVEEAVAKVRAGLAKGTLKETPLHHLAEKFGSGKLTENCIRDAIKDHVGMSAFGSGNGAALAHLQTEQGLLLQTEQGLLLNELNANTLLKNHYHPSNFQTVGFRRGHITEDLNLINNTPTRLGRLMGETEATVAAREAAKKESAVTIAEMREGYKTQSIEMREQHKIDSLELENKVKLQKAETRLRQKYGLEKKPMGIVKQAVLGGGAIAGGVLGYNALTGGAANNGGMMAQAESEGAQAAIRDAMSQGYGGVQAGYGIPMPQVQAANLNYEGRMNDGMALGRA